MKNDIFGGYRLIGYLDRKPLIAKYSLGDNHFDISFNEEVLDGEQYGKFSDRFLSKDMSIVNGRQNAPTGRTLKRYLGPPTPLSAIAWLAAVVDVASTPSSGIGFKKGLITKNLLHYVADAIYTSDAGYIEEDEEVERYSAVIHELNLPDLNVREAIHLDAMIHVNLYPKLLQQVKGKSFDQVINVPEQLVA